MIIKQIKMKLSSYQSEILNHFGYGKIRVLVIASTIIEVLAITGVSIYRGSFVPVLSDAFDATSVGGIVNFVYDKLGIDGSLPALDGVLTDEKLCAWLFSGLSFILLKWYNILLEDVDFGSVLRSVFSIILTVFMGLWCAKALQVIFEALTTCCDYLSTTSFGLAKMLTTLISIIIVIIVLLLGVLSLRSLYETVVKFFLAWVIGVVIFFH